MTVLFPNDQNRLFRNNPSCDYGAYLLKYLTLQQCFLQKDFTVLSSVSLA